MDPESEQDPEDLHTSISKLKKLRILYVCFSITYNLNIILTKKKRNLENNNATLNLFAALGQLNDLKTLYVKHCNITLLKFIVLYSYSNRILGGNRIEGLLEFPTNNAIEEM